KKPPGSQRNVVWPVMLLSSEPAGLPAMVQVPARRSRRRSAGGGGGGVWLPDMMVLCFVSWSGRSNPDAGLASRWVLLALVKDPRGGSAGLGFAGRGAGAAGRLRPALALRSAEPGGRRWRCDLGSGWPALARARNAAAAGPDELDGLLGLGDSDWRGGGDWLGGGGWGGGGGGVAGAGRRRGAGGPAGGVAGRARSRTVAPAAMPAASAALSAAVSCNPVVNASRAAPSRAAPASLGSWRAAATAPPRVSCAAAAAWPGIPGGRALARWPR